MKAIVVLSHLMDGQGRLDSESKRRAKCGARILKDKKYDSIITLGWAYRKDVVISLAESMKRYMTTILGIEHSRIEIDNRSRDTVGDAVFSKLFFLNKEITFTAPLVIVTSFYHIERAKKIFGFVYGNTNQLTFIPTGKMTSQKRRILELKSLRNFEQTFSNINKGDINQIIKRLAGKHPYYNGTMFKTNLFGSNYC